MVLRLDLALALEARRPCLGEYLSFASDSPWYEKAEYVLLENYEYMKKQNVGEIS